MQEGEGSNYDCYQQSGDGNHAFSAGAGKPFEVLHPAPSSYLKL